MSLDSRLQDLAGRLDDTAAELMRYDDDHAQYAADEVHTAAGRIREILAERAGRAESGSPSAADRPR